jgi:hypothetical protein
MLLERLLDDALRLLDWPAIVARCFLPASVESIIIVQNEHKQCDKTCSDFHHNVCNCLINLGVSKSVQISLNLSLKSQACNDDYRFTCDQTIRDLLFT